MSFIETAVTQWHRFVERVSNASTPTSGHWSLFFKSNGLNVIDDAGTVIPVHSPNDLSAWGTNPDDDLHFAAQKANGLMRKVRGDEMRYYGIYEQTTDGSDPSSSMMMFFLDSATDITRTITAPLVGGHSVTAKVIQNAAGNHKILLPVSCGWNGTSDRAALLGNAGDFLIAVARSSTNYEVIDSLGVTYAAS